MKREKEESCWSPCGNSENFLPARAAILVSRSFLLATLVSVFYPSLTLSVPIPKWIESLPFRRLFDRSLVFRLRDVICRNVRTLFLTRRKRYALFFGQPLQEKRTSSSVAVLRRCSQRFWGGGDELAGDFTDR
jgi:hypothetical protein